jgi:hypothetical protein
VTDDRSSPEFADHLLDIAAGYPEADTIHLVMDNLSSHTRKAVVERFVPMQASGCGIASRYTTRPSTAAG